MSLSNTVQSFLADGKVKEDEFAELLGGATKSTQKQDMSEHWDLKFQREVRIDVKAIKRDRRSGQPNEDIHWVELQAVSSSGKVRKGWLYGQATHFAFETVDYWSIVKKEDLQSFIAEKCKDKIKVDSPMKALYKLYTRNGRNDIITKVKTLDLFYLSEHLIKK